MASVTSGDLGGATEAKADRSVAQIVGRTVGRSVPAHSWPSAAGPGRSAPLWPVVLTRM